MRYPLILVIAAMLGQTQVTPQDVEIATALSMTEGPTVDRDGNVYFTEIMTERIMRLSKDGVLSTYREHSNAANGLLIDPQGRLIACEGATSSTARRYGLTRSEERRVG